METLWQRSVSPLFKLISATRRKSAFGVIREDKEHHPSVPRKFNLIRFARFWSVDAYGNLFHGITIMTGALLIGVIGSNVKWILLVEIIVIATTLIVLILDLLIWLPASITLFFESIDMIVEYRELERGILKSPTWRFDIDWLYNIVTELNLNVLSPYFIARFLLVIVLTVISFAAQYTLLSIVDSKSFLNASGEEVQSFGDFLYGSVMMTTTIGPSFEPTTEWGKAIVATHALVTVCILVIVVTFFGSLSEEKLKAEKNKTLNKIEKMRRKDEDAHSREL